MGPLIPRRFPGLSREPEPSACFPSETFQQRSAHVPVSAGHRPWLVKVDADGDVQWESATVWSSGGLDVNEAPPEFLARALEVSIDDAMAVEDRVTGIDGIRGNEDDVPFNNSAEVLDLLGVPDIQRLIVEPRLTANDPTTRIESTGWSGDIRRRVTLIVRNRTGRPSIRRSRHREPSSTT